MKVLMKLINLTISGLYLLILSLLVLLVVLLIARCLGLISIGVLALVVVLIVVLRSGLSIVSCGWSGCLLLNMNLKPQY